MIDFFSAYIPYLIGMSVLLLMSGFFSSSETAVFNLSWDNLRLLKSQTRQSAKRVLELHKDRAGLIITILFGNKLVNIIYFSLSAQITLDMLTRQPHPPGWVTSGFAGLSVLLLILFGEIIPKMVAVADPPRHATRIAMPIYLIHKVFVKLRLVTLLDFLSRKIEDGVSRTLSEGDDIDPNALTANELKIALEMTSDLHETEKELIREVIRLDDIDVRKLMTPRTKLAHVPLDTMPTQALATAVKHTFHDLPVTGGSIDDIRGVVTIHDLYRASKQPGASLNDFVRALKLVPDTMPATELMRLMREEHFHFAAVVDEYGQTAGVVTMEDCLEAIFGEISDEYDDTPEKVRIITPGKSILRGEYLVTDWVDRFQDELTAAGFNIERVLNDDYVTMSGMIVKHLQKLPVIGDTVNIDGVKFIVRKTNPPGEGVPVETFIQILNRDSAAGSENDTPRMTGSGNDDTDSGGDHAGDRPAGGGES